VSVAGKSGADAVMISSPAKLALTKNVEEEIGLDRVAERILDMDIILVEDTKDPSSRRSRLSARPTSTPGRFR
jgi:molybdopterin-guanine dinucleotide biosynthesis protein